MNFSNPIQLIVSRKTLQQTRNFKFNYKSPIKELEKLAKVLQIEKLKSLSFKGRIFQSSRDNYIFQISMQANLVQLCVISLSPMKVKINHDITQYFSTKVAESKTKDIIVNHEFIETEQIHEELNIGDLILEELNLKIPLYPKKKDINFEGVTITESGVKPLDRTINNPFQSLKTFTSNIK